jgi:hypothetical protein
MELQVIVATRADKAICEALALRKSHPNAPAADVLDLVMRGHADLWPEDLFDHLAPPAPFGLLVAEAVTDCMTAAEWCAFTGPNANERVREAMLL